MARYFCRVCDSNNGWVVPSGAAVETRYSHHGNFRFAYEEWNFNPALLVNGWQYGWIEGFKPGPGRRRITCGGPHDVAMYVRRNGQCFFVGKIMGCEVLEFQQHVPPQHYPGNLAVDANNVGASVVVNGHTWFVNPVINNPKMLAYQNPAPGPLANVRFRPSDAKLCKTPTSIPISYTRYGALLVDNDVARKSLWQSLSCP